MSCGFTPDSLLRTPHSAFRTPNVNQGRDVTVSISACDADCAGANPVALTISRDRLFGCQILAMRFFLCSLTHQQLPGRLLPQLMGLALKQSGVFKFSRDRFDLRFLAANCAAENRIILLPLPPKCQVLLLALKDKRERVIKGTLRNVPGLIDNGVSMDVYFLCHSS